MIDFLYLGYTIFIYCILSDNSWMLFCDSDNKKLTPQQRSFIYFILAKRDFSGVFCKKYPNLAGYYSVQ